MSHPATNDPPGPVPRIEAPGDFPALEVRRSAPAAASSEAPRLGISHLLLWTGCCAAYFAVVRQFVAGEPGALGFLLVVLQALAAGAAWAGLAVFVTRRFRGAPYPIEAGEWLLASMGAALAVESVLRLGLGKVFGSPDAVLAAVTCCLLVVPALARSLPSRWKAFFLLLAMLHAWPLAIAGARVLFGLHADALARIAHFAQQARLPTGALLLAACATLDYRRGERRGWLHWIGIAAWIWMAALLMFG
jgi:hypothetical protein